MPRRSSFPPPSASVKHPVAARIVRQARAHFFSHGYCHCTMDDLATELGMSKRTLYMHFASKEDLMRTVIAELGREIRNLADALLADRRLNFAEKLRGFAEGVMQRLGQLNPRTMRDLQRFAPDLHQLLAEMREKNIPYVFGRFIEEGRRAGLVRTDLDADFAVLFFLQAMHGLVQPAVMERLHLTPRELLPRAINLFFAGMLTPAGRKNHEKHSPV